MYSFWVVCTVSGWYKVSGKCAQFLVGVYTVQSPPGGVYSFWEVCTGPTGVYRTEVTVSGWCVQDRG